MKIRSSSDKPPKVVFPVIGLALGSASVAKDRIALGTVRKLFVTGVRAIFI